MVKHAAALAAMILTFVLGAEDARAQSAEAPSAANAIEWRAVNRFRLFGEDSDRLLADVYAGGRANADWVHVAWQDFTRVAERAMFDGVGGDLAACARADSPCEPAQTRAAYDVARQTRFLFKLDGANLATEDQARHVWDRATHAFNPIYVTPNAYRIRVRLASGVAGACAWSVQSEGFDPEPTINAPCDADWVDTIVRARWPATRAADGSVSHRARVSVTRDGRVLHERQIEARDVLIVGMGDSFASGEGAPDVAANWSALGAARVAADPALRAHLRRVAGETQTSWIASRAASDNVAGAIWFDQQCHRSLLSWQAVSAMALAAEREDLFVTFMSFACGGASTVDGMLVPQTSPPGDARFEFRDSPNSALTIYCSRTIFHAGDELASRYEDSNCQAGDQLVEWHSQITQALNALCGGMRRTPLTSFSAYFNMERGDRDNLLETRVRGARCARAASRPIDHLLVTLGGNDIGFAEAIMWSMLPSDTQRGGLRRIALRAANNYFERAKCPYVLHRDEARCASWLVDGDPPGYRTRQPDGSYLCTNPRAVLDLRQQARQAPHAHYLISCYLDMTLPAFQDELAQSGLSTTETVWSAYPSPVWRRLDPGRTTTVTGNSIHDDALCGVVGVTSVDSPDAHALSSIRGSVESISRLGIIGRLFGGYARFSTADDFGFRIQRSESFEVGQEIVDPLNDTLRRVTRREGSVVIDSYLGPQQSPPSLPGATDHVLDSEADGRGWCATDPFDPNIPGSAVFGQLRFPQFDGAEWVDGVSPAEWRAHGAHRRLFRTPNDAVLTQYAAPPPPSRSFRQLAANGYALKNGFGGMMHPGPEFHSMVAEAAMERLR